MNMVEKVARAIQTADEQNGGWPYERVIKEKHARNALFDRARAAIEAMRSPTPEMTAVMKDYIGRVDQVSATWQGMIDAALKDPA